MPERLTDPGPATVHAVAEMPCPEATKLRVVAEPSATDTVTGEIEADAVPTGEEVNVTDAAPEEFAFAMLVA